jgi:transposase-like protein
MPHLGEADRLRVVLVYESNQNITLTAKKMHVDAKTVRKWVKRYQQDKVVTDKKRAQRTSCVPDAAAQRAVQLLLGNSHSGLHEVAQELAGTTNHTTSFKNKKGQKAKNITTQEYEEVVLKNLLPEGKRIFSHQGISTWTLQQDNDPTHKKGSLAALNKWHQAGNPGVELLSGWPANSPDLSPIENIWAWAQQKVDKMGCKTFPEFQQAVLDTLNSVPASMLRKLFASMPRRTGDCMALEGAKTSY